MQHIVNIMMSLSWSQNGCTPLHAACQKGYDGVVHLLLQAGAHVEKETKVR